MMTKTTNNRHYPILYETNIDYIPSYTECHYIGSYKTEQSITGKSPALLDISMGTIIVNEYLRNGDIPVSKVIFDGYVADPKAWNDKLAVNGKKVRLPKGYKSRKYRQKKHDTLFIVSEKDTYSTLADIPKAGNCNQMVKTFDCEHISGFFRYPNEYTAAIVEFLNQK